MNRQILLYGFSIFSMFFGSGNLVFPLKVGLHASNNWLIGFMGFFCTGIILPFLGLFVIKLHRGNYYNFFGEAGRVAKLIIPIFTLSLLGSFGVIPRCITVAYGGIEYLFPGTSLLLFSTIFCSFCFIFSLNDRLLFSFLGKFLTPILLFFLILLIFIGISSLSPKSIPIDSVSSYESFITGFFEGYKTMDLFAAFFFSSLMFKQIEQILAQEEDKNIIRAALKPSLIGALILAFVYFGFVYLGSHYKDIAFGLSDELILPAIANHLLGKGGALVIAIIIIFSCLTTAVALNNIYARYLSSFAVIGDSNFKLVLLITTIISFIISLFNFEIIAIMLTPMLKISYPALIVLTILSICLKGFKSFKIICFYSMILIMLIFG